MYSLSPPSRYVIKFLLTNGILKMKNQRFIGSVDTPQIVRTPERMDDINISGRQARQCLKESFPVCTAVILLCWSTVTNKLATITTRSFFGNKIDGVASLLQFPSKDMDDSLCAAITSGRDRKYSVCDD
jgi:hypothetical protein